MVLKFELVRYVSYEQTVSSVYNRERITMITLVRHNTTLLIASFFVFTLCFTSVSLAKDDLVTRGQRMLEKKQYDKAITFFKAAINSDGSNQAAWDAYQQAIIAKQNAEKDTLKFDTIPRNPQEMTPDLRNSIQGNPTAEPKPSSNTDMKNIDDIISEKEAMADAMESNPNSIARFATERVNPWRGLPVFDTVDPTLLHSPSLARQRYDSERRPLTVRSSDQFGSGVEAIATYVPMSLYKYLAVALGAERGWSYKETDKRWVLISRKARKYHEFAIDIREVVSPRRFPFLGDIASRTTLIDDNGNRYKPVDSAGPSQEKLQRADTYSVCYPKTDADGTPIEKKATKYFFLEIKGLGDYRNIRKLKFNKELFLQK